MAKTNTLTGLIPTLYEALNVVSREMVGFIPAVKRDSKVERAALGQTVRVPIGAAGELEDIVPGVNPKESGGTTPEYADIKIEHAKAAPVLWNGEEQLAVGSNGTYNQLLADQFSDAMRKLVNSVEKDIAQKATVGASRAYGTKGKVPFGVAGDLSDFAGVAQVLDDNGAPISDRQLVLGSGAMMNLRGKQSVLFKVNEAGANDMLRNGMTDRVQNFALRYSGGIGLHKQGAGTGYIVSGAAAQGLRGLTVKTGTGVVEAGDIVNINGYSYIVSQKASSASDKLTLNAPGLVISAADGEQVTSFGDYTGNFAFNRSAIVLASRAPAVPNGGDSADDAMYLTDPVTGLTFEVRIYRQYRQVKYEVCLAWGAAVIKPEHVAILAS
ncbi:P22 coat - protein 5 family protein [Pasteurellaceae bacterium USgator11]|nr:P22 coat - protein 5 family protein [Pasteurellaceae bacterium USgator41]TNG96475.1 P22 coat - protein 5 family protein [Pasteurellaceae bacterium UScroc12]TNH00443.1 P22 coat - protein 5 family protein [Pasteurellaceae bacterium UScroc31]TNH01726.1 P22 coat - protein 5 family protein [Pasteurellaceae bacterium USgator11]